MCDDHNLLRESPRALKSLREKEELFLISTAVDIECKHCGRVDYFVSHSWEDDAVGKSKALMVFARAFESKYGRRPSLWLDKVCIDQRPATRPLTPCKTSSLSHPIYHTPSTHRLPYIHPTYHTPYPSTNSHDRKVCIDQKDQTMGLAVLPINIGACNKVCFLTITLTPILTLSPPPS